MQPEDHHHSHQGAATRDPQGQCPSPRDLSEGCAASLCVAQVSGDESCAGVYRVMGCLAAWLPLGRVSCEQDLYARKGILKFGAGFGQDPESRAGDRLRHRSPLTPAADTCRHEPQVWGGMSC